jgi:hypothetical protein
MLDIDMDNLWMLGFAAVLLVILVISFGSRARVFCQYMRFMTGVAVTPRQVKRVFHQRGKAGVRELFLDLLMRADLADEPVITPDTPRAKPAAELISP